MRILLEGPPGVGKTTLVERVVARLEERDIPVQGFTTREIRERGRRLGFRVEAIGGPEAVLAHVDLPGPPRVGRYGVDLPAFERVALPSLRRSGEAVVVIDELGKMELASPRFQDEVTRLLDEPGPVAAAVHAFRHPFTEALKARSDLTVLRVTPRNRDQLPAEVVRLLTGED
ncbi:MAG: NTPase [Acidimicrobiia bacterium]